VCVYDEPLRYEPLDFERTRVKHFSTIIIDTPFSHGTRRPRLIARTG